MNAGAPADHRVRAPFGRRHAEVTSVRTHGPYTSIEAVDRGGPLPLAGQFYMLQTASGWGGGADGRPYLPRALSFARAKVVDGALRLSFLLEAVGPGTARLAACEPGETLLLAGPFGNGFRLRADCPALLVAGGVGLAPIVALSDQHRREHGVRPRALVGMRDATRALAADFYGLEYELATEDGGAGHAGFVTELLDAALGVDRNVVVYACGPPAMLEAVRDLCSRFDVDCRLALESGMACGYGACYGCVVPTVDGYLRLCVDGPVIEGDRLEVVPVTGAGH